MTLKLHLMLGLAAAVSCTNSQALREDERRISGVYLLKEVDGMALPASISPQQGCNRIVRNGDLNLIPTGVEARPLYGWSVAIIPLCVPSPPGVSQGTSDSGSWVYGSEDLFFSSLKNHGRYKVGLEDDSGVPPAITIPYLGNSYRFTLVQHIDEPTGGVFVKVVDQTGQPVEGVILEFVFRNGLKGGGTTPASGEFGTSGVLGNATITITPPANYVVPSSQPNPFSVSVTGRVPPLRVQVSLTKI